MIASDLKRSAKKMKKPHPRPEKDFRVTCVAWELDIERRQVEGGFEPVPREVIIRRYFQFISFLQRHGMTTRTICRDMEAVKEGSELRNFDLTDAGFYYTQKFHGRWLDRKRKDGGESKEWVFLEKWLAEFQNPKKTPNQAPETTICTVTDCAPSSTLRASADRVSP
jgi:hypothetical protein